MSEEPKLGDLARKAVAKYEQDKPAKDAKAAANNTIAYAADKLIAYQGLIKKAREDAGRYFPLVRKQVLEHAAAGRTKADIALFKTLTRWDLDRYDEVYKKTLVELLHQEGIEAWHKGPYPISDIQYEHALTVSWEASTP